MSTALSIDTSTHTRRASAPASSPPSPLSQPPFFPDGPEYGLDDVSPAGTSVVTPGSSRSGSPPLSHSVPGGKTASEHIMLNQLAQMPSPNLGVADTGFSRHSYPLLPPHHPLRNKMYATMETPTESPLHTPKGHPIESKMRFPKTRMHPISNPYSTAKQGYTSALTYILRVPRRLRPVMLVGFCLVIFVLVYMNHAVQQSHQLERLSHAQAAGMGRRYVEREQLVDINDRDRQGILAQQAEAQHVIGHHAHSHVEALQFETAEEELAALISFVTSTTANALPDVDPNVPIDPSVILDFDPAHPSAKDDLELLVKEVHTLHPVVLFGRMRDPWQREIKMMLAEYRITPAPLVIDVDQRRDSETFVPMLARLLGTGDLPQLLLQGKPLGSYHEVLDMRDKGTFAKTLEASDAVSVRDIKKKKKGIKERERIEMERILGPQPIQEDVDYARK